LNVEHRTHSNTSSGLKTCATFSDKRTTSYSNIAIATAELFNIIINTTENVKKIKNKSALTIFEVEIKYHRKTIYASNKGDISYPQKEEVNDRTNR